MARLQITEKRRKLLKNLKNGGGITQEKACKIYSSQPVASKALNQLIELGLITEEEAPPKNPKSKLYFITDFGKDLLEHSDS